MTPKRFNSSFLRAVNATVTSEQGNIYNKKPFKYRCEAGRVYMWCSCGWSHTQPFCDGTHMNRKFKIQNKPIRFECVETKEYWFCQCKQTRDKPFCDGSHNLEAVQEANSTVNQKY